jgi:DNA-binding FrmR family transcriptional regulator
MEPLPASPTSEEERIKMEKDLLSRINKVQGQLESTKRLSKEEKALLMLELHSAIRALESIRRYIILRDLHHIRERFDEHKDKVGIDLTDEVLKHLAQKYNAGLM